MLLTELLIYYKETKRPIVNDMALRMIATYSNGDMRRALNHLQLLLSHGEPLTPDMVRCFKPIDYGKFILFNIHQTSFMHTF